MSHGDSTVVDGGSEPGHIGHHSPTNTNDEVCSCQAELGKPLQSSSTVLMDLAFSPSPMRNVRCSTPASTSTPTPGWVTIAALVERPGTTGPARGGHQVPRARGKTFLPGLPSALSQQLQR